MLKTGIKLSNSLRSNSDNFIPNANSHLPSTSTNPLKLTPPRTPHLLRYPTPHQTIKWKEALLLRRATPQARPSPRQSRVAKKGESEGELRPSQTSRCSPSGFSYFPNIKKQKFNLKKFYAFSKAGAIRAVPC